MAVIRITAIALLLVHGAIAQTKTVAITIDDLPAVGKLNRFEIEVVNSDLQRALEKHKAIATVFVNERGIEEMGSAAGTRLLQTWAGKGHDLGNHTYSHADLSKITVADFEKEVTRGEATIRAVLQTKKRVPQYLRFPYNHMGDTPEKRNAAETILYKRGYKLATCTIENSDYEFARVYQSLLTKKNTTTAAQLVNEYLAFTGAEIDYYSNLHQQVFGYQIPHVMLLHANKLNAETLDAILTIFEKRQYRFVTLEQAQSDPAYRMPIRSVTAYGPMWGYRWAKEKNIKVNGALEPEPPSWILKYDSR